MGSLDHVLLPPPSLPSLTARRHIDFGRTSSDICRSV